MVNDGPRPYVAPMFPVQLRRVLITAALFSTLATATAQADYAPGTPGVAGSKPCYQVFAVTVFDPMVHRVTCGAMARALQSAQGTNKVGFAKHFKLAGGFTCNYHVPNVSGSPSPTYGYYKCAKTSSKYMLFRPYSPIYRAVTAAAAIK